MTLSCGHNYSEGIEAELAQSYTDSRNQDRERNYSDIISSLRLLPSQRIALSELQIELNEELAILKIREQKLNNLLSQELLKVPYDRKKVRQVMVLIVKTTKKATNAKLRAMLNAKNIIREGLSKKDLLKVAKSRHTVETILGLRPAF